MSKSIITSTTEGCRSHFNILFYLQFEPPKPESDYTLEDSLQIQCTQLQKIIADRTEELRVVSQQLYIAKSASQHKSDLSLTDFCTLNVRIDTGIEY